MMSGQTQINRNSRVMKKAVLKALGTEGGVGSGVLDGEPRRSVRDTSYMARALS